MRRHTLVAILGLGSAFLSGGHATAAAPENCDRTCLNAAMNEYLTALIAHDPHRMRLAPDARFTENGMQLELGDGLWGTATGLGNYKHYFEDPREGQVGFFGTLRENNRPIILAARLKVSSGLVREIETVVVRFDNTDTPGGDKTLDALGHPDPIFAQVLPENARRDRNQLRSIADAYFEGYQRGSKAGVPFDPDCERINNGERSTNDSKSEIPVFRMGCADQLDNSPFTTGVSDRRFLIFDEERGLVFAIAFFDHNARVTTIKNKDGSTHTAPPVFQKPATTMVAELFKIVDGNIRRIECRRRVGSPTGRTRVGTDSQTRAHVGRGPLEPASGGLLAAGELQSGRCGPR